MHPVPRTQVRCPSRVGTDRTAGAKKLVSINQPAYLPWTGYFHRIAASDVHVVLDHVQFEKNSFTNRNKIRTREGWTWLTVPVKTKGRFGDLSIAELEIDDTLPWRRKHWAGLKLNYGKSLHFAEHAEYLQGVYDTPWGHLGELTRDMLLYQLKAFGISTPLYFSSEMGLTQQKSELVLEICQRLEADEYLSGPLGRQYLDEAAFSSSGIDVSYDDYTQPVYGQAFPGFEPYMAAVDLLFNEGPAAGRILATGQVEAE